MKNSLNLSIANPCHEKWENFEHGPNGGFCSSCRKTVVDMTRMSDQEILRFFTQKPSGTCGRLRADQLKHYPLPKEFAPVSPGITLLKAGFLSLVFAFLNSEGYAASVHAWKPEIEVHPNASVSTERIARTGSGERINGTIRDAETGDLMPGVNVVLKGSTHGTSTDANGKFHFPVDVKEGDVLVISFIGYRTTEFVVPAHTGGELQIELTIDIEVFMGAVAVEGLYQSKPTLWSRFKNLF